MCEKKTFESVFSGAEQSNEKTIATRTDGIRDYMENFAEIRILVAETNNFGHQASSINILRALIRNGWERANKFTVCAFCNDDIDPQCSDQKKKIRLLIPEFQDFDIEFNLYGAKVTVIALKKHTNLDPGPLALCGGWDDQEKDIDIALGRLKVTRYLQLQPYAWQEGTNLAWISGKFFNLDTKYAAAVLNQRAFFIEDPVVETEDWNALKSGPWEQQALIVEYLAAQAKAGAIEIIPVYGVATLSYAYAPLINLVSVLLQRQKKIKSPRPIVVVEIQELSEAAWNGFVAYVDELDVQKYVVAPSPDFRKWHTTEEVARRVKVDGGPEFDPEFDVLKAEVEKLKADELYVTYLGPIPQVLFNFLYGQASLPPVLEGQNTVELMLNLGKPYFKIGRRKEGASFAYPTLPLGSTTSGTPATFCYQLAGILNSVQPNQWREGEKGLFPPTDLLVMVEAYLQPDLKLAGYFKELGEFFHKMVDDDEVNGKLFHGLDLLVRFIDPQQKEDLREDAVGSLVPDADSPLEDLYNRLVAGSSSGTLNLLPALSSGIAYDFFQTFATASAFAITEPDPQMPNPDLVTLTGSSAAIGVPAQLDFTFKPAAEDGEIATDFRATFATGSWMLAGAPWLSVSEPSLGLALDPSAIVPVSGSFGATVTAGFAMKASVLIPSSDGIALFQGDFQDPRPSITNVFQMVGGINLQSYLPPQLQIIADMEVQNLEVRYRYADRAIDAIGINLSTPPERTWKLVPGILVNKLTLGATINSPGDLANRSSSYLIGGEFGIVDGTGFISAELPGLRVQGGLTNDSDPVTVRAFVQTYLGDAFAAALPASVASTAISRLGFTLDQRVGSYSFGVTVTADWQIPPTNPLFTVTELGLDIEATSREIDPPPGVVETGSTTTTDINGTFTGALVLLPNAAEPIGLSVMASYATGNGWTFEGRQTSGQVSLGDLLHEYLHWDTGGTMGIDGLSLTITTKDSSWTFTGKTAEPWTVPFIDGLTVEASLTAGYNGTQNGALALAPVARSSVANALAADGEGGFFARVETNWKWESIEIMVFFDYAPDKNTFGITWGALEGLVEGPDENSDYTASLKFKDNVTLGSLIEDMVSWLTRSKFALASPFDILNAIPLSNLALVYTFNTKDSSRNHVSFAIDIGPIELGFARIDAINVSYRSKTPQEDAAGGKGVMVELTGSFLWQSDPSKPLGWDAAKPETTPAPPGGGNKYFNLRLLALGQHVTVPGFREAATVQAAIDEMEKFPDPDPGELPPVIFDPGSNWLIGLDLQVLRFGDDDGKGDGAAAAALMAPRSAPPAATGTALTRRRSLTPAATGTALTRRRSLTPAAGESDKGYVLTLQIVFNDPNLYGLRVALAGDAAKVLKGLDFQIMYRQISDTVGVYQAEITLPDLMRHLTVGAYSITLPVFAIQVYTNGDFLVDIGFPWNSDFSRSFTIEAIIPPGIPLLGSAGFYLGKLSSATTNRVPRTTNGTFNPVIVFGFGMQVGFGKSIEAGILKAGFSVTVVGILEGVIAKWNPYLLANTGAQPPSQVQGQYYFWLRGTVGIVGRVYGTVDFAIVKADVNITVKLLLQLTYESFVAITITVVAEVEVSVSISIDLGLFSITIHFSFSMQLKETFAIDTAHDAPWQVADGTQAGVLRAPLARRLTRSHAAFAPAMLAAAPKWGNLTATSPRAGLDGYFVPALAVAQDEWEQTPTLAAQTACAVGLVVIKSVPPSGSDGDANFRKAAGSDGDTSFEAMAKMVLRWVVAALQSGPISVADVDKAMLDPTTLDRLANEILVSTDDAPAPFSVDDVDTLFSRQFQLTLVVPPADKKETADAAYFPASPKLALKIPAYGNDYPGYQYAFGSYNALGSDVLRDLRKYFDDLAIKVQQEMGGPNALAAAVASAPLSMAGWVFSDYVLLIARQMVKAADQALRDFQHPIVAGETANGVVAWVNTTAKLTGDAQYTLADLLGANPTRPLNGQKTVTIGFTAAVNLNDTFPTLSQRYANALTATALAGANAAVPNILQTGGVVTYPGKPDYPIGSGDTLLALARHFGVGVNDLFASSNLFTTPGLLHMGAPVLFPFATASAGAGASFTAIANAAAFGGGFNATALATVNAGRSILLLGAKVSYPGNPEPYVVKARDTLGDVAAGLGVSFSDLLANSTILTATDVLAEGAVLALPVFGYATASGDTLQAIASRFGVDVSVLGDQSANGDIVDLFARAGFNPGQTATLDIPHLPQFPLGELINEAQRAGALQHLSGMVSRYMLHGLRFPTKGITPNAAGMWVHGSTGSFSLPQAAGLYALTGQQFPLPTLDGKTSFSFALDRTAGPDWIAFAPSGNQLTVTIAPSSDDATRIGKLVAEAHAHRLDVAIDALGGGEMYRGEAASYPFTSVIAWQNTGPVPLPYGPPPAGVPTLRLWRLPDAMVSLPDPSTRAVNPRFALKTARYDEATGQTIQAPISSYGFASTITFIVKRVPALGAANPASADTYEIVGAGGNDIVLLERLVAQAQHDDGMFASLTVGFAPDSSGPGTAGVMTDPADAVTFGLAQVNLTTETRPPAGVAAAVMAVDASAATALGLLNHPTDFVRLLWEASITRSGGFYLYYFNGAAQAGLPDRIFNDRNEATLTLIVLYANRRDLHNRVANFMNAVATADAIDLTSTVVFAQADPVPVMIGTKKSTPANASLTDLSNAYFVDPQSIVQVNAKVALGNAQISVSQGTYQAPVGGIALATLAANFGTTVAALNAANPNWHGLPDPLVSPATIRLPALTVTVSPTASLDDVAGRYGEPLTALAAENATVQSIFSGPLAITLDTLAQDTIGGLATAYFADPADVAQVNQAVPLNPVPVTVSEGIYQAPLGGIALATVATNFGTTVAALNAANPKWGGLPDPLPFPAAIRLPRLTLTPGTSPHGATLQDISSYYGESLSALAAENAAVAGLFKGQAVVIPGGPSVRAASVPPGVQAVAAERPSPPPVPAPTDPNFAKDFLLNAYTLLNQQIFGNVDFLATHSGLPAGPTTAPSNPPTASKIRAVTPSADIETWDYGQAVPYYRFVNKTHARATASLPDPAQNPYVGVGALLQVSFQWQDHFGNLLITSLSNPQAGDTGPLNTPPMATGYTDPLVALGQWPSVGAQWRVVQGQGGGAAQLQLLLAFDPGRYAGLLYAQATSDTTISAVFTAALDPAAASDITRYRLVPADADVSSATLGNDGRTVTLALSGTLSEPKTYALVVTGMTPAVKGPDLGGQAQFTVPDDPAMRSSSAQQAAKQALATYGKLYYQLTDPNGIVLSIETTLLAGSGGPGGRQLPQSAVDRLNDWLFGTANGNSIYAFLTDRAGFGVAVAPPPPPDPFGFDLQPSDLNSGQIFELWLTFTVTRTGGAVLGGLETTPGIRRSPTRIAPLADPVGGTGTALGLTTFARSLEGALSSTQQALKVATGTDRFKPQASGASATVWIVRLGSTPSQPVSYQINADSVADPAIFAPAPVSNELQSRQQVPIYNYTTGQGISPTPSQYKDFTDVDVDVWCQQIFAAIDGVLTPQFTAPMQIVGKFKAVDYLQQSLDAKRALADIAKKSMIPVFKSGGGLDPSAAQEAFYQQLLVELSNAYTTRAAVQYTATVNAAVDEPTAPRLFGAVEPPRPAFVAANVDSDKSTVFLHFTDPLDPAGANNPANYVLSGAPKVQTAALAGTTVTLTTTIDVIPGTTTVTVQNLIDTQGRPLQPPLTRPVLVGDVQEPAISLTASKLTLASGNANPLVFLLSAPATVRGPNGEVIREVDLDLIYKGAQIEHQIGSVAGIDGYEASTWLNFVLPVNGAPLWAPLTQPDAPLRVPLVLRVFPATPTMAAQEGQSSYPLDQAELNKAIKWDYTFTYSLPFHFPQDRVKGKVEFNLAPTAFALAGFVDAFNQLAEFVTVFPAVNADLVAYLAAIDATTDPTKDTGNPPTDKQKVDNAAFALAAFVKITSAIVTAASGGGRLALAPRPKRRVVGAEHLTYTFYVNEGETEIEGVNALLVTIVGALAPGMPEAPVVEIEQDTYQWVSVPPPAGSPDHSYCYVYKAKDGSGYLTAAAGQAVPERTVLLRTLDILERQDAFSTVYLERNRELVPGKESADAFVYTTPSVGFSNPLFPINDSDAEIDISTIGSSSNTPITRSLVAHLTALFSAVLAENIQPKLTFQVEATYSYPLNAKLTDVSLPVAMQAPLTVTLQGTGVRLPTDMIADWAHAIELWFTTSPPKGGGTLWFDLVVMSDLTLEPMPLLRLRKLLLPLQYIDPPLRVMAPQPQVRAPAPVD